MFRVNLRVVVSGDVDLGTTIPRASRAQDATKCEESEAGQAVGGAVSSRSGGAYVVVKQ
jgi:hypothetical protein